MYREANHVSILLSKKEYRENNKVTVAISSKNHYRKNKEVIKKQVALYKRKNKDKVNASARARDAKKLAQSPTLTPIEVKKILILYLIATKITTLTDIVMHVDHIIPLSKGGLHHPLNLQVLTEHENTSKQATVPDNLSEELKNLHNEYYKENIW